MVSKRSSFKKQYKKKSRNIRSTQKQRKSSRRMYRKTGGGGGYHGSIVSTTPLIPPYENHNLIGQDNMIYPIALRGVLREQLQMFFFSNGMTYLIGTGDRSTQNSRFADNIVAQDTLENTIYLTDFPKLSNDKIDSIKTQVFNTQIDYYDSPDKEYPLYFPERYICFLRDQHIRFVYEGHDTTNPQLGKKIKLSVEKFLSLHGLTLDTLNDAITKYKTDDLSIVKKYIKMYSIIHNYAEEDIKKKLRNFVEWACKTLKNHINQLEMLETHFENTIKNDKLIDRDTSSMMIKSQLE